MHKDHLFDHLEDLLIYARQLTRDTDSAEELVQDVVLHLLSKEASFDQIDNPRAYMARSLRNLFVDQTRRNKLRPQQLPLEDHEPCDISGDAFQSLACADTLRAIGRLPPEFRTVMRMRVQAGMTYADMAEALDLPIGTVMSRMSRARERLRAVI